MKVFKLQFLIIIGLAIKLALSGFNIHAEEKRLPPTPLLSPDTQSDRGLLTILKKRQVELDKREKELREKESELNALKKEIGEKIVQLTATQENIKKMLAQKEKVRNKQIEHLVEVYSSMNKEKAARLIEKLDDRLAVGIMSAMDGKTAGKILSQVDSDKAARISQALTYSP